MASVVGICNAALTVLGARKIVSLADDSEQARLCNLRYADCRDVVLRLFPWNGAIHRKSLARDSETPDFGFDHQYQLPTNPWCLRVLTLNEDENGESQNEFAIEGRLLLTDAASADIRYIKRIDNPNEMDPLLRDAIAAKLASEIAYKLTKGSAELVNMAKQEFILKMQLAQGMDAQEGTPFKFGDQEADCAFLTVRT